MTNFLRIKTIFSSPIERNIEFLTTFYEDIDKLVQFISDLFYDEFLQNDFLKNKTVLLKPNWVIDSSVFTDEICLRTHNNFILATLEVVASQKPTKITIADAPVQGAHWEKIVTPFFFEQMKNICLKYEVPLIVKDLRKTIFYPKPNFIKKNNIDADYTTFNLGLKSMLEPISLKNKNLFRNTHYDADRLKESHYPGTHKYCIATDFFKADVIISLPKIKTHQKAGITCALKNLVGINGDKDFLPHHRIGGLEMGGDCYPGKNRIRYISEKARDIANRNTGNYKYTLWAGIAYLLWKLLPERMTYSRNAGWHGNDTTWRMVQDINTIALNGKEDGTIASHPQRVIYSLCDGIIGGQGNGPLNPDPLPLGIISFTNDSVLNDIAIATLMEFDWQKIFLLKNLKSQGELNNLKITLNNSLVDFFSIKEYSTPTIPPAGWKEYLSEKMS